MTEAIGGALLVILLALGASLISDGWWNAVDAFALYLHRKAVDGRARAARVEKKQSKAWDEQFQSEEREA